MTLYIRYISKDCDYWGDERGEGKARGGEGEKVEEEIKTSVFMDSPSIIIHIRINVQPSISKATLIVVLICVQLHLPYCTSIRSMSVHQIMFSYINQYDNYADGGGGK